MVVTDLKYIWKYEFDPKNAELVSEKNRELDIKIKKNPNMFPILYPSNMTGLCKGFRIIDAENEKQLINLIMFFFPLEKWEITPILVGKAVSRSWREQLVSRSFI